MKGGSVVSRTGQDGAAQMSHGGRGLAVPRPCTQVLTPIVGNRLRFPAML